MSLLLGGSYNLMFTLNSCYWNLGLVTSFGLIGNSSDGSTQLPPPSSTYPSMTSHSPASSPLGSWNRDLVTRCHRCVQPSFSRISAPPGLSVSSSLFPCVLCFCSAFSALRKALLGCLPSSRRPSACWAAVSPGTPIRCQSLVGRPIVPLSSLNHSHFDLMTFSDLAHSLIITDVGF